MATTTKASTTKASAAKTSRTRAAATRKAAAETEAEAPTEETAEKEAAEEAAAKTSTAKKAAPAKTSTAKKAAPAKTKPQAVADDLDFNEAMSGEELKPAPRRSKWVVLLDKLYEATVAGKVPRDEEEELQFIRLGTFGNINGARTQARMLERKGHDATYQFKTVTRDGDKSELWGRVIEVEA